MMNASTQTHKRSVIILRLLMLGGVLAASASGCTSVPGETLASGSLRRDISSRVLQQANAANAACKSQKISNTEVLELHPDGRVAAERWSVDQCGAKAHYRVSFPPGGRASGVMVRPE
jgi:hypothetical protein